MASPNQILWPDATDIPLIVDSVTLPDEADLVYQFTLEGSVPYTDKFTGETISFYDMPEGNVRNVMIIPHQTSNAGTYVIVEGTDPAGNFINEQIDIPEAELIVLGDFYYSKFYNITYYGTPDSPYQISIGVGPAGYTSWFNCDTYNKTSNYSISYTTMSGTNTITPSYTNDYSKTNNNTIQYKTFHDLINDDQIFSIPIANNNIIISPSTPSTLPVSTPISININGMAMQAITAIVDAGLDEEGDPITGSFVQTIIQQGAKF